MYNLITLGRVVEIVAWRPNYKRTWHQEVLKMTTELMGQF